MRHTIYALLTACLAMFATSGVVALATAAPEPTRKAMSPAEAQLVAQLDTVIQHQLDDIKTKLHISQ